MSAKALTKSTVKADNLTVTKSNLLVQCSRSEMTMVEMRILLYAIAKIKYTDTELKPITLSIKEFAKLSGVPEEAQYSRLREITKKLRSRTVEIFEDKNTLLQTGWLQYAKYNTGKGTITLQLETSLAPQLLQLRKNFTSYALQAMLVLDSRYAMQLYELFKSYENLGRWRIERDELYRLLGATGYTNFGDFRRFVIEPSIKQINSKTDVLVKYDQECEGRKVSAILFEIAPNEANQALLEQGKDIDILLERLIVDRPAKTKERELVAQWFRLGYDVELIMLAAEYCSKAKGKLVFSYMNQIIKQWSDAGIVTVVQAEEQNKAEKTAQ